MSPLLVAALQLPLPSQDDPESRRAAIDMMNPIMVAALEAKNFGRARNICDQAIIWEPQNPLHHYNLACIEAQTGGARLPFALGALDLAIALGFADVEHLKTDPDLQPLHGEPKFAEMVRKATYNATAGAVMDAITLRPTRPESAASHAPDAAPEVVVEKPAPAAFHEGVPVGLYFMSRYRTSTRVLENTAWYFAPDGRVYQNLEHGFSQADLEAHAGPKGAATAADGLLEVSWVDGTKTRAGVEREGTGFLWDMGIFTAVAAFNDPSEVTGVYESGDAPAMVATPATAPRLEFFADGTFAARGIPFTGPIPPGEQRGPAASEPSKGRWQLAGYSLILTSDKGVVLRRLVFPYDDAKTNLKPDRMFFGGVLYRRQF